MNSPEPNLAVTPKHGGSHSKRTMTIDEDFYNSISVMSTSDDDEVSYESRDRVQPPSHSSPTPKQMGHTTFVNNEADRKQAAETRAKNNNNTTAAAAAANSSPLKGTDEMNHGHTGVVMPSSGNASSVHSTDRQRDDTGFQEQETNGQTTGLTSYTAPTIADESETTNQKVKNEDDLLKQEEILATEDYLYHKNNYSNNPMAGKSIDDEKTDDNEGNKYGYDTDDDDNPPVRWIQDRINGSVMLPEAEEKRLPQWKRRPPSALCFLSPLVGLCPRVLEDNIVCASLGRLGIVGGNSSFVRNGTAGESSESGEVSGVPQATTTDESLRTLILGHALLLNTCGLIATICSAMSLTKYSTDLIRAVPFARTTLYPTPSQGSSSNDDAGIAPVTVYLGLLALGVTNPNLSEDANDDIAMIGFRDFCSTPGMELLVPMGSCDRCAGSEVLVGLGFFLAVFAYLPTIIMGFLRLYKHYDTNCQKVSAGLWSFLGLVGYSMVIASYYEQCLSSMFQGDVLYSSDGQMYEGIVDNPEDMNVKVTFDWRAGVGQILFLIGFGLKIIDFVCSCCCVATPPITRSRELQWKYEVLSMAENGDGGGID